MSPFEIVLIIIGIVCIVASCFLVESKSNDTVDTELGTVTEQILFNQLSEANEQISEHISSLKNEVFEKTKDDLERLSNEKIIAVHEYSNQVMGDIKKSHQEVMFLYQMLTDKEDDLKKTLQELQTEKHNLMKSLDQTSPKQIENQDKPTKKAEQQYSKTLQDIEEQEFSNHIEEILELSRQGMSVIDISKRLGLGQGEVKLVLDYNKKL